MPSGLTAWITAVLVAAGGSGGFFADTHPIAYLAARDRVEIGQPRAALSHLERSLTDHPRHGPSFELAVRLRRDLSGGTTAAGWVRRHLDAHPDPSLLRSLLSGVRLDTGVRLGLLEWADTAGLEHPGLLSRRLNILRSRGRWEKVYRLARRGRSRFPESYEVGYALGAASLERGRLGEARRVFDELINRRPGRAAAYHGLARVHLKQDREPRARERYDQFRALVPTAPSWSRFRENPSVGPGRGWMPMEVDEGSDG